MKATSSSHPNVHRVRTIISPGAATIQCVDCGHIASVLYAPDDDLDRILFILEDQARQQIGTISGYNQERTRAAIERLCKTGVLEAFGRFERPEGEEWEWVAEVRGFVYQWRVAPEEEVTVIEPVQTTGVNQSTTLPEPRKKGKRGPRAGSANARHGGMAVKAKYGDDFFKQIGSKGGTRVRQNHGSDFYTKIGKMGGSTTRDKFGSAHYERIGHLGGTRARQREREQTEQAQTEQQ